MGINDQAFCRRRQSQSGDLVPPNSDCTKLFPAITTEHNDPPTGPHSTLTMPAAYVPMQGTLAPDSTRQEPNGTVGMMSPRPLFSGPLGNGGEGPGGRRGDALKLPAVRRSCEVGEVNTGAQVEPIGELSPG